MGTWITALAKDYKGYLQYDKIQGCDEHCNVCNMTVAPSNLTVLTPALCGARTQTHSSTHIVLHTHSYKHLYTVSQYNTYQHKHTETQTRAKTHVHRQRHRERHMDTNWLSHKLNCLQFVQPAQLTYFAFHKFGLCYSQAEFVLLTSWVCATHKRILCHKKRNCSPGVPPECTGLWLPCNLFVISKSNQ